MGAFYDKNSGETTYTIRETTGTNMSTVIKTDKRNCKNNIELMFNDTGIRPGKEYQVVVEAKGCKGAKAVTGAITIKTDKTIKPQIVAEKERFQEEVLLYVAVFDIMKSHRI